MGFAAAANAQSSITLYGIVDNGLKYETGFSGGHRLSAESGNWSESRFDDPVNGSLSSSNPNYRHGQFGVFAGIAPQF